MRRSELRNIRNALDIPWISASAVSTCGMRGTTLPAPSRTTTGAMSVRALRDTGSQIAFGRPLTTAASVRNAHFWSGVSTLVSMSTLTERAMWVESASVSDSVMRSMCSSRSASASRFSPSASW